MGNHPPRQEGPPLARRPGGEPARPPRGGRRSAPGRYARPGSPLASECAWPRRHTPRGSPARGAGGPVAVDVALAALTFAATMAMLPAGASRTTRGTSTRWGIALAALTALPLLARRRWPLVVFPAVWIPTVLLYALGYSSEPPIGSMIALYEVAASPRHSRTQAFRVALVVAAGLLLFLRRHDRRRGRVPDHRVRLRRRHLGRLLVRRRPGAAAARASGGRPRARGGAAAGRRGGGAHPHRPRPPRLGRPRDQRDPGAGRRGPAAARQGPRGRDEALETIEEVARETLGDIDRMVRALRDGAGAGAPVEPPSGAVGARRLAERHRASGLEVTVDVRGSARPLPAASTGPPTASSRRRSPTRRCTATAPPGSRSSTATRPSSSR